MVTTSSVDPTTAAGVVYMTKVKECLEGLSAGLGEKGITARPLVLQSSPAQGILDTLSYTQQRRRG